MSEKMGMLFSSGFIFGIIAIALVVAIFVPVYLVRCARGKKTTNANTYAPQGGKIVGMYDRFTHQTQSRTRVSNNRGGGGGHGGGRPGGGGHRGGGRGGR